MNSWSRALKEALGVSLASAATGMLVMALQVALVTDPKLELALGRGGTLLVSALWYGFLGIATFFGSLAPLKLLGLNKSRVLDSALLRVLIPGIALGILFVTGAPFRPIGETDPLIRLSGFPGVFAYVIVLVGLFIFVYFGLLRLGQRAAA